MRLTILLFALILPVSATADDGLRFVDYNWLSERTNVVVDFEQVNFSGRRLLIDELYQVEGAVFGERFDGQILLRGLPGTHLWDFDVLAGRPSSMLSILAGAPGQNLSLTRLVQQPIKTGMYGESWIGFPSGASSGEGAISILFDAEQIGFGFRVHASHGENKYELGLIKISCFDEKSNKLGEKIFGNLEWDTLHSIAVIEVNQKNIIKGCSIENTDPKGVLYDDFIFTAPSPFLS